MVGPVSSAGTTVFGTVYCANETVLEAMTMPGNYNAGPCCGNTFNVSAVNVNNIGFDLRVERTCPGVKGGCTGVYIGWGQELLLAWKAGASTSACKFPAPVAPSPPKPPPPPSPMQCYYSSPALPPSEIKEVLIIDADHLDEGYHGQVTDVNNRYFDVFWPRALRIAKELKAAGNKETYSYTTFSWLVSLFFSCPPNATGVHTGATGKGPRTILHCPNETYKEEVRIAIKEGVLTWAAFPFNSELSAYDRSLIEFGINHTHALDDYFGVKRKITLPDRDVPGITRSLIPILLENGIGAINEAPNGAMHPTNVPPAFIWKDADSVNHVVNQQHGVAGVTPPSGKEIVVMWWEEGCDSNCLRQFPGSDVAVLFDWRGEDSGPNVGSAADVLKLYAQVRGSLLMIRSLHNISSYPLATPNLPRVRLRRYASL
jgi:hypothetical protein